jgi:hypothetical protein
MKKFIILLSLFLILAAVGFTQGTPKKVMNPKGLDKFIIDYPKITKELDASPVKDNPLEREGQMNGGPNSPSSEESFYVVMKKSINEVKKIPQWKPILRKYGWDDTFWDYLYALSVGSYVATMEQYGDSSPLPENMKKDVQGGRSSVHSDDLALIQKNLEKIMAMMDDSSNGENN